jgi:peptide/nickel transport system substrate-binding protein
MANTANKPHPKISEAFDLMKNGRMDRREFVRMAALLGLGATTAYALAGLKPAMAADATLPFPADDANAKKGGALKVAMQVQKMEDPASYAWVQMSNQTRHIAEYLVMTGPDNVTRPMLAEKWQASEDLKTWTITLRKEVMWHTGEEFTSEHVKWNFERWMDPKTASSNIGLSTFSAMVEDVDKGEKDKDGKPIKTKQMIAGSIDTPDKHTIVLKLTKPVLSVPEDLYNYPTAILHPSFVPPFASNAIGTGPFMLSELKVGEKCILKRITKTTDGKDFKYWGGEVYLDEIQYFNYDAENQLTAVAAGDTDVCYEFDSSQLEFAKTIGEAEIVTARTAQTSCIRMQVDQKPFDNKKIRQAFVKAIDNDVVKNLTYPVGGDVAQNHHVAPIHPEYFELPTLKRDVDAAKALLKEAGVTDTLQLTVDVGNTEGPWQQAMCEAIRDQVKEAGINLNVNVMPASKYWEIWDKTVFGATSWTHRPLGTMVLSLAYRTGVPWNESHYANPEFDAALDAAEATLDVTARKGMMEKVQKILQDDAVFVQVIWRPIFAMSKKNVHGFAGHPTQYHQFNKVWVG